MNFSVLRKTGLGFLLLAIISAGISASPVQAGFFGEGGFFSGETPERNPVSGRVLKKAIVNRTLYIETPLGTEMPINFYDDGTMTGKAGILARYLSKTKIVNEDRGVWWMEGNSVCQKWTVWMDQKPYCFQAERKGRGFYWWSAETGRSGNARVGEVLFREAKTIEDLLERYR